MQYQAAKKYILGRLEQELDVTYTYHGLHHTLDVLQMADELCKLEKIGEKDTTLIKTAALFHDAGFLFGPQDHESKGCDIVRATLPQFDYTDEQITQICGMIMATKIPQSPKNHLEQILADADLDYLGRDDFFAIGNSLYSELVAMGVLKDEKTWNLLQIKFLESHHFHTVTNINRREAQKQAHLEQVRALVL